MRAKHIVLGTNGFTHLLPPELGLKRAQLPMFVYQLITEPLTDEDWKALDGNIVVSFMTKQPIVLQPVERL